MLQWCPDLRGWGDLCAESPAGETQTVPSTRQRERMCSITVEALFELKPDGPCTGANQGLRAEDRVLLP